MQSIGIKLGSRPKRFVVVVVVVVVVGGVGGLGVRVWLGPGT